MIQRCTFALTSNHNCNVMRQVRNMNKTENNNNNTSGLILSRLTVIFLIVSYQRLIQCNNMTYDETAVVTGWTRRAVNHTCKNKHRNPTNKKVLTYIHLARSFWILCGVQTRYTHPQPTCKLIFGSNPNVNELREKMTHKAVIGRTG